MNKRITSLILVFTLILTMLATAVPALAAPPASSCTYSIEADKTSANPGDTINFTIYMQQTGKMNTLEGTLVIPDGLTFVTGSGKLEDGIKTTLGWDSVEWTPVPNMILNGFGSESFTGTDKLAVMKFQCTVDNDATAKDYEVTLIELVADDENYETKNPTCIPATITVSAAPVAVTGVTIDETLSVNIGQTKTPSFTVAPAEATNKTVSFTSDNPAVATVNATTGEVTGVSKGTATITVKTADGNFTDTCTVTVSCAHTNKSTVPAKDSTCTVKGWDEYKKCDDCGQLFDTSDVEIDEIPFLNLANHTGGTATCTTKAVCSVCHQPYGNYAAHTPSSTWNSDENYHWKECTVVGCGVIIEDSKAAHTASDWITDTEATATTDGTKHKECTECGYVMETGTIPATGGGEHTHSYGSDWKSNADKHWHECSCGAKAEEAAHTASDWITDTAATATTDGTKHKECTECKRVLENGTIPAIGSVTAPKIIAGDGAKVTQGEKTALSFRSDADFSDFIRVEMDGKTLDAKNYTVKEGSTVVTLNGDYVSTLSVGTHTIGVVSQNGTATATFTITGKHTISAASSSASEESASSGSNPDKKNPQTGDNSMMGLWIAVLFVSGVGVVGTTIYSRKKKYTVK